MNTNLTLLLTIVWLLLICCGNDHKSHFFEGNNFRQGDSIQATKRVLKVFGLEDFYSSSQKLDSVVQKIYEGLTVKERAAQLIMEATSEVTTANLPFARAEKLYADSVIGGLLFLKGKKAVFEQQIQKLDAAFTLPQLNKLLYSCDCEPTLFHQKIIGADPVKASSSLKTVSEVEEAAAKIAATIKMMGIQINFAPVTDIALNRKAINNRSFGSDPSEVIKKSVAFVNFTQGQQIASCVKHFPGHGAVEGDTHKGQVIIDGNLSELNTFQSVIIQSHPVLVMVGHMTVKNNAFYGTGGVPCSVSSAIIKKLLKTELGFKGIVITDAMRMSALNLTPDADWKALEAGVDIVLMPRNARLLNNKIIKVLSGTSSLRSQLEGSIKKVLRLKVCSGRLQ